jgi:hypothetical protein
LIFPSTFSSPRSRVYLAVGVANMVERLQLTRYAFSACTMNCRVLRYFFPCLSCLLYMLQKPTSCLLLHDMMLTPPMEILSTSQIFHCIRKPGWQEDSLITLEYAKLERKSAEVAVHAKYTDKALFATRPANYERALIQSTQVSAT